MTDEEQGLQIGGVLVPDHLRPIYANYVNVNHTPWDFRLTFALLKVRMPGPEAEAAGQTLMADAVADIMIPANLMYGLIAALRTNYERYLEAFGPPGMEPEGPGRKG
ncbi:MAG: DUF3467 domain-containing protein [Actinomycetota bacterium]